MSPFDCRIQARDQQISSLTAEIEALNKNLDKNKNQLRERNTEVCDQKERFEKKINQLEKHSSSVTNENHILEQEVAHRDAIISSLNDAIKGRDQQISHLKAENEALTANKKKKKKEDETQLQELLYWKRIAAEHDEQIKKMEGQVRELGTKNDNLLKQ